MNHPSSMLQGFGLYHGGEFLCRVEGFRVWDFRFRMFKPRILGLSFWTLRKESIAGPWVIVSALKIRFFIPYKQRSAASIRQEIELVSVYMLLGHTCAVVRSSLLGI